MAELPERKSNKLITFDTTLRDGEQSPGVSLDAAQKVLIAKQLSRLGIDVCEIGFPANTADLAAVQTLVDELGDFMPPERQQDTPMMLATLARCNKSDIDAAWTVVKDAKNPRVHVFYGTSETHLKYKLKKTQEECLQIISESVAYARSLCDDIEFSPEDGCRTEMDFLVKVCTAAIDAGATTLNIPDTVGFMLPSQIHKFFSELIGRTPRSKEVIWSTHCHNDLGCATANSLAGLQAGCNQVEGTINGIGERAGNTALEEVVMAVKTHPSDFGITDQINTELFVPTSDLVMRHSRMVIQKNKAIVGVNAFLHESGVHVDGFLKNKSTYQYMSPESVGWSASRSSVVLGKLSGRAGYQAVLEAQGITFTSKVELNAAFERYQALFYKQGIKNPSLDQILGTVQPSPQDAAESKGELPEEKQVESIPHDISRPDVRPMTLCEKILCHNAIGLRTPEVKPGDVIVVKVARTLGSEMTWVGMEQTYKDIGKPKLWRNDRFFLAMDHTMDPRNIDEPRVQRLITAAKNFADEVQLKEYQPPNTTILHTEFYRQKAVPGQVIIGSDSHSCSAGCLGTFAAGLGAGDVMLPVVTGQTWFQVPETVLIKFTGKCKFGIMGKDVMLHILGKVKRNTVAVQRAVEFGGNIAELGIDSRFALSNMATEFGGIAGVFPADEITQSFLNKRQKKKRAKRIEIGEEEEDSGKVAEDEIPKFFRADPGAEYAETCVIDLSEVIPTVAKYPEPDNVYPIDHPEIDAVLPEIGKSIRKLDGCFIGACTTAEEEMILAALVLEECMKAGMKPSKNGNRRVTPGSVDIVANLERIGTLDIYRKAGFTIGAPGCSYCLGVAADVAPSGEVWLSSQNRNFRNRMGPGSIGNLASAITVAASSFNMEIIDPMPFVEKIDSERYHALCNWEPIPESILETICSPSIESGSEESVFEQATDDVPDIPVITGRIQRFGDHIDTDAIIPAQHMLDRPLSKLAKSTYLHVRPEFRQRCKDGQTIVVAGEGYGSGSSREEAVLSQKTCGIQAVIAKSFAFIYGRNQITLDLIGIIITDEHFYEVAQENVEISIDVPNRTASCGGEDFTFEMSPITYEIYRSHGIISMYKELGSKAFKKLAEFARAQALLADGCAPMAPKSCEATEAF